MPGYDRLRLPAAYGGLRRLDARGFAWEWLRRNPDFQSLWASAGRSAHRASRIAETAIRRSARPRVDLPRHPLAGRWSPWGLTFRPAS